MPQHISYPSIEQFRNVIRTVKDRAQIHGIPLPELEFTGTVKLHGTNASIAVDMDNGELWSQSRSNIIDVDNDNAGFARFVHENALLFRALVNSARTIYGLHEFNAGDHLIIYGEWCGGSIQKGVALNQLPKMFVIFGVRVKKTEDDSYWFDPAQISGVVSGAEIPETTPIYSIHNFPTFRCHINFARPEEISNKLGEITLAVENECPVGKRLGVIGVGEGVVWTATPNTGAPFKTYDLTFKVKGEKHSETKVKTLAPVDVEKINNIRTLVETICTEHRLEKKLDDLREQGLTVETKNTGTFLKIVGQDVAKEEADTIDASGLPGKDVMAAVSKHARQWYLEECNKI